MTETEVKEFVLTALDRCDACDSAAYVQVTGVTGDLLFCAHHFNNIEKDEIAMSKMQAFAFDIIDERERLIENRLKGEEN
jgi:hypothetical protein